MCLLGRERNGNTDEEGLQGAWTLTAVGTQDKEACTDYEGDQEGPCPHTPAPFPSLSLEGVFKAETTDSWKCGRAGSSEGTRGLYILRLGSEI